MNILFLSLTFSEPDHVSMYEELLQVFRRNGDAIYVACAKEKRSKTPVGLFDHNGLKLLRIATGNITGNIGKIEKGISTLMIDRLFLKAIEKHFSDVKFDLILYPTPPITFLNTIASIKQRTGAKTYLLLKDIFPQNAVDLGMMTKTGVRGLLYKMFRRKEKKLYAVSDYIGCMSPANVKYVLNNNPWIPREKVEICPNCINCPTVDPTARVKDSETIRKKYGIADDAVIFLYGGNLGQPQGIPSLIKCIDRLKENNRVFFLIVGNGVHRHLIKEYIDESHPANVALVDYLPKKEYQNIARNCDVGLIFLDHRFTIPNFPSRMLACLTAAMPILVATDRNCDMGPIAQENGFGFFCESNDVEGFAKAVNDMINADRVKMGKNAWNFFLNNYTTEIGYNIIIKHFQQLKNNH